MWKLFSAEVGYLLAVLGFVVFGALAHAFNALQTNKDQNIAFTGMDFFILAFLATFSGMLFGLLTFAFVTQNVVMVTLFSGLGSFSGIVGLNKVTAVALESFINLLKLLTKK
jgi:hypothetical protein